MQSCCDDLSCYTYVMSWSFLNAILSVEWGRGGISDACKVVIFVTYLRYDDVALSYKPRIFLGLILLDLCTFSPWLSVALTACSFPDLLGIKAPAKWTNGNNELLYCCAYLTTQMLIRLRIPSSGCLLIWRLCWSASSYSPSALGWAFWTPPCPCMPLTRYKNVSFGVCK